jgi:hypothetical protein
MSACGEAEIRAGRSLVSLVPPGLRGFFAAVARFGVWRLPVFLVVADARESDDT